MLCPLEALDWENRQLRVLEELVQYSPHIICLQEVDKFQFVQENLGRLGYKGMFFPKPDSPCLDFEYNTGPDGCAMFYLEEKLQLLSQDSVVLQQNGHPTNQVSIICSFSHRDANYSSPNFTVAVTHLKAKSAYHELRLRQGSYLLNYLENKIGSTPIIVCGDFNADPKEPIYSAFKASPLQLTSCYTSLSESKLEPKYTTWKIRGSPTGNVENCKTIDYIWHSKHFRVKAVLDIPKDEDLGENKLPSWSFPSDHLSLVCDLQLSC